MAAQVLPVPEISLETNDLGEVYQGKINALSLALKNAVIAYNDTVGANSNAEQWAKLAEEMAWRASASILQPFQNASVTRISQPLCRVSGVKTVLNIIEGADAYTCANAVEVADKYNEFDTVAIDTPVFTKRGRLFWRDYDVLLAYNNKFTNAAWTNDSCYIGENYALAFDGNNTATLVRDSNGGMGGIIEGAISQSAAITQDAKDKCAVIIFKRDDSDYFRFELKLSGGGTGALTTNVIIDTLNMSVSEVLDFESARVEQLNNDYYAAIIKCKNNNHSTATIKLAPAAKAHGQAPAAVGGLVVDTIDIFDLPDWPGIRKVRQAVPVTVRGNTHKIPTKNNFPLIKDEWTVIFNAIPTKPTDTREVAFSINNLGGPTHCALMHDTQWLFRFVNPVSQALTDLRCDIDYGVPNQIVITHKDGYLTMYKNKVLVASSATNNHPNVDYSATGFIYLCSDGGNTAVNHSTMEILDFHVLQKAITADDVHLV